MTRAWVKAAGTVYVVAGSALALLSFVPAWLERIDRLLVPGAGFPDVACRAYAGVAGGLTAGIGVMIVGVATTCDARGARALAAGLGVWFVLDTMASLGHGAWPNAVGNVVFLAIGLVPLLRLGFGTEGGRDASPTPDGLERQTG
jgi:hypothetical protein